MLKFILFVFCCFSFLGNASGNGFEPRYVISWELPRTISFGYGHSVNALSFEGAIYSDIFEGVPLFYHQEKSQQPFVKYLFDVKLPEFQIVSDFEKEILEKGGFDLFEIIPKHTCGQSGNDLYSSVSFFPFRVNQETGNFEKLVSFHLAKSAIIDHGYFSKASPTYAENSVLAAGSWYKVCVDKTGVFQLTHTDLASLGVNVSSLDKANIRLFGNGGGMLPEANDQPVIDNLAENAIFVSGNQSGAFTQSDYLLFFGESPNQWVFDAEKKVFDHQLHYYSKETCYFITTHNGTGKRIGQENSIADNPTHQVATFRDRFFHERELRNLLRSGKVWFGEVFESTSPLILTFEMADVVASEPARVRSRVAARSGVSSMFTLSAGGDNFNQTLGPVSLTASTGNYASLSDSEFWFNPSHTNRVEVSLQYNRPSTSSRGFLDFVSVNVSRQLKFDGPQMSFRNVDVIGDGNIARFNMTNANNQVVVWDVTDKYNIRQQQGSLSGTDLGFTRATSQLVEFVAFDGSSFFKPRLAGSVSNQNLHAMQPAELIIVVPDLLLAEANQLANFRTANDGISVAVITTSQVYNEFSSGVPDIGAIRNFMKMFYDRTAPKSIVNKYLLLFGNGTYDNKNILGHGGNLIPTFQSKNSVSQSISLMSDDFFAILDDHEGLDASGLPDLGVGRLPVRTIEEARAVVDKIIRYQKRFEQLDPLVDNIQNAGVVSNYADWRNRIVLIADDEDNNTHFDDAEEIASIIGQKNPTFNVDKIYLDAYQQINLAGGQRYPEVNQAINESVNRGTLLVNYIGHGGINGLAHERVVTFDEIASWKNFFNLPVFLTATCEFSSFDNPDPAQNSAGVRIFMKPDGGASALITSTRIAWSSYNQTFNRNFSNLAFARDEDGNYPRLGDLIRQAKVNSGPAIQTFIKNFVLLGDPSMKMAYPELKAVTTEIPDTIKALQHVTVSGQIVDHLGNPVAYNGVLFPTVFDKDASYTTLGQDPGSTAAHFFLRNSILFKGKASITNGQFSFSFVVPKDISYNFGNGKISYYFDNGGVDGHGCFTEFIVGGSAPEVPADNQGPDIQLYINDLSFASGGETTSDPLLIAILGDESGINTTGRLGHDIVAFLNDNTSAPIILNRFFEYNVDDFTSGRIVYPFFNLPEGHHTLTLRVWDNHNNPSVAHIDFVVSQSAGLTIEELLNYPNPFGLNTTFSFTHNRPFTDLNLTLQVFDLSGRLVKTIDTTINTPASQAPPIHWDGRDNDGRSVSNGVYVYRVVVSTPQGVSTSSSQKLIILK